VSVSDLHTQEVIKSIVKGIIEGGDYPSSSEILTQLNAYLEDYDLTEPRTKYSEHTVEEDEVSSVSKYNGTLTSIHQDLVVMYKSLLDIADESAKRVSRWKKKGEILEGRLKTLVDRISNLLLLETETAGYYNFVQDNFKDLSKVDQSSTTARIDLKQGVVSLGVTSYTPTIPTKQILSLKEGDVEFSMLTKDGVTANISSPKSKLVNAFNTAENYFQQIVYTNKPVSLSAELKVKLSTSTIFISRIDVNLHASNNNAAKTILPLYSADGKTWYRLPITNYTLSIVDTGMFVFPAIEAQYFKFILTKSAPDVVFKTNYAYEFGVDEIAFYNETVNITTSGQELISKALSVTNPATKEVQSWSKVAFEACELIEENTNNIDYYVAVSNDSSVSNPEWQSIAPASRTNPTAPTILDFSESAFYERSGAPISYDPLNADSKFVNPKQAFFLLSALSGSTGTILTATSSSQRYDFFNKEDRLLDFAIMNTISFVEDSLEVWRNVNTKGGSTLVRGNPHGWGFSEDYYTTTVLVKSAVGIDIDFGPKAVVIDDVALTGCNKISCGSHTVKVHKDNWYEVDYSTVNSLAELRAADKLYPYNHRYLVEGFNYRTGWNLKEEKIYKGFDIVAEYKMKRVSPFELIHSVSATDYARFALDYDASDTSRIPPAAGTSATKVFLVKVDDTNSDFLNEAFTIRLRASDTTYKYLKLRAILKTTDSNVSPLLSSYRIKLGA